MKNKVSMQDIADSLGVSKVTVSKVLRGKSDVSESVEKKVKDEAFRLGYCYDGKSRKHASKIMVLTAEHFFGGSDCFYVKLYRYLSAELETQHIDAILTILDRQSENENVIPEKLKNREVDGVIVMGQIRREYLAQLREMRIPMVFLDFYYDDFDVTSINTDNFFSAYEMTNRLIRCGHTEIGFVGTLDYTSSIQDRFLGYCKALIEHHISFHREWVFDDRESDGRYLEIRLPNIMPTAFVCNCDEVAMLLINNLKQKGYRVPLDISVAGFDDSIHAVKSEPQITTVHVNLNEMAHFAVKAVLRDAVGNSRQKNRILSRGKIISRESVLDLRNGRTADAVEEEEKNRSR